MYKNRGTFFKLALSFFVLLFPILTFAADASMDVAPPALAIHNGYQLEVNVLNPDAASPLVRLTFQRPTRGLRTQKLIRRYRIDYLAYPESSFPRNELDPKLSRFITQDKCKNSPDWHPVVDYDGKIAEWPDRGILGKVRKDLKGAISGNFAFVNKPTYFRIVATEADDENLNALAGPIPLVCSTLALMPARQTADTIQVSLNTVDNTSNTNVPSKVTIDGKSPTTYGFPGDTTPLQFSALAKDAASHTVVFTPTDTNYKPRTETVKFDAPHSLTVHLVKTLVEVPKPTVDDTSGANPSGGQSEDAGQVGETNKENCGQYITFGHFNPSQWAVCELFAVASQVADFVTSKFDVLPINSWPFIRDTQGIRNVWVVSLSLIDIIVVVGLIVAAFANIFRFKIDTYAVKQILPGLIIGIILANLSFFIMRLLIELSAIASQVMGILISQYAGTAIGNDSTAAYIAHQGWAELSKSLFIFPGDWVGFGFQPGHSAGGAFVLGTLDIAKAAASFLFAVGVLIFMIIPLVMFAGLLILIYIRHYALIILFMISPLAFFCIGFPPLKAQWTRFWGFLWKWLVMMPASFAVVGFMIIFLHFVNAGNTTGVDPGRYLLVNGIGIGLLFLALKVPSMFGQFYGGNLIDLWNSNTKNLANRGAKKGIDLGAQGAARVQVGLGRFNPRLGSTEFNRYARLQGKNPADLLAEYQKSIPRGTMTLDEYTKVINNQARRDAVGAIQFTSFTKNPYRQVQAAKNVFKNYQAGLQKADERYTRRSPAYSKLSQRYTPYNFTSEQYERYKDEFADNLNPTELKGEGEALRKVLMDLGYSSPEASALIEKMVSTSASNLEPNIFEKNPRLLSKKTDIIKGLMAWKQLRLAINQTTGAGVNRRQAFLDAINDPSWRPPYAPGDVETGGPESGSKGGETSSANRTVQATSLDRITQNASQTGLRVSLSEEDRAAIASAPTTAMSKILGDVNKKEKIARDQLLLQGLSTTQIDTMLARVRKRALNRNAQNLGNNAYYGMTPQQFSGPVKESLQGYGRAVGGMREVLQNSIDDDGSLARAQIVAKQFSANQSQEIGPIIEQLNAQLKTNPPHNQLLQIRDQLSRQNIPVQNITDDLTQADLQARLTDRLEDTRKAVLLHQEAGGGNIEDAVLRRQGEDLMMAQSAKVIDTFSRQQQVQTGQTQIDPASFLANAQAMSKIQDVVKSTLTTNPLLHQESGPDVAINDASVSQLVRNITTPLVDQFNQSSVSNPGTQALDIIHDPSLSETIRQSIRQASSAPVETVSTPAEPQPAISAPSPEIPSTTVSEPTQPTPSSPVEPGPAPEVPPAPIQTPEPPPNLP